MQTREEVHVPVSVSSKFQLMNWIWEGRLPWVSRIKDRDLHTGSRGSLVLVTTGN